jgi:hypothetical protein
MSKQPSDEQSARFYAAALLRARADLVEAGGIDGSVQEIHMAALECHGSVKAAGAALVAGVRQEIRGVRKAADTAKAARHARLNTPEMKKAFSEMVECRRKADDLERHAQGRNKRVKEKVDRLIAEGVSREAALAAAGDNSEAYLREAQDLRKRAAQIERQLGEA